MSSASLYSWVMFADALYAAEYQYLFGLQIGKHLGEEIPR